MKKRAGKMVQNLSGEMAYDSFYPQPLPPEPNIEIDAEMRWLLIDATKMNEDQIHAKIQKGYDSYKAGRTQNAAAAFEKFRERSL